MKKKKFGKNIIKKMDRGLTPQMVAAFYDMSLQGFYDKCNENEYLKECLEVGLTKLEAFYQRKLIELTQDRFANKDAIRIFYSHYLNVFEKSGNEQQNNINNSDILKEIAGRLPE